MIILYAGSTSQTIDVFIPDSSSTTGAGLSGLVYNSSGLKAYYRKGATGTATAITLATQTVGGAYSSGGFVEIDATNMKGTYRLDIPNAAIDTSGFVTLYLYGATNMAPVVARIDCRALPVDVKQFGGTSGTFASGRPEVNTTHAAGNDWGSGAITAASIAASALNGKGDWNIGKTGYSLTATTGLGNQTANITGNLSGSVGSVTGAVGSVTGAVTVGTNNDKTGYSLTQAFPTNFAALGINASGHVSRVTLVDTVTTLTGYATPLDAVGVRSAVGLATANLDTQLSGINSKTTNLPSDPADASDIAAAFSTVNSTLATIASYIDTEVAAIQTYLTNNLGVNGAALASIPWNASWDAEVQSEVADALSAFSWSSVTVGLTAAYDFAKGTAAMTEAYAAAGGAMTPVQALHGIHQLLWNHASSGTTFTVKKRDGSTTAKTGTYDSSSSPTSLSEAT